MEKIKQWLEFYDRLEDEESKNIAKVRMDMLLGDAIDKDFYEMIQRLDKDWEIAAFDDFRNSKNYCGQEIIIFGAGIDGKMTRHVLGKNGIDIYGFCDNNKTGMLDGKPIFSVNEVIRNHKDKFVVLASNRYAMQFWQQLNKDFPPFPKENIWMPREGVIYAKCGKQYFDCPMMHPMENEVFIDAGSSDGITSVQFAQWCLSEGRDYKKIYAFEPEPYNYDKCVENERKLHDFNSYNYATWDSEEKLLFDANASNSASVRADGKEMVQGMPIDHIVEDGDKATFIKLDVEGAEYNTLLGARKTIVQNKPRLAVSLYHRRDDVYRIPILLVSMREDYKFYIRHYTNMLYETVLYAI